MAIKEAKQNGSQVLIKNDKQSSTQVSGKLVGYTSKAVFVVNGQNVLVYVEKGGGFGSIGTTIIVFRTLLKSVFAILNRYVWLCV